MGGGALFPQAPNVLPWLPSGCLLAHHTPDTAPQENSRTHLQTLVLFFLQMMKQRVRGERALLNALTRFNSGSRGRRRAWCVTGMWQVHKL